MIGTIVLCVVSTLTFCFCARSLIAIHAGARGQYVLNSGTFSVRAKRLARSYAYMAISLLAIVALVGAIRSYVDLFSF